MNVLLSRTDRIGDLILSTPAIATVRASFPQAVITLVTSDYNRVAMERNDDIDELVTRRAPKGKMYDVAVALAPRVPDLRVVRASRARRRIGYTYVRRWFARLSARLYVDTMMVSEADPALLERHPELPVRHEVDQLLDLVALAGATQRVSRLRLDVRDEDRARVASLPEAAIVFHLGDRWFRYGSTFESTQRLLEELAALGRPIIVTTPPESSAYAAALVPPPECTILGVVPFFVWAAAFERAACVVTVDTAATHVASAMGRPTLVAFEYRFFELSSQEWAPYGVPNVMVRKPPNENASALTSFRSAVVAGVERLLATHA